LILVVAGIGVCPLTALRPIPSAAVMLRKKGWLNGSGRRRGHRRLARAEEMRQ
jgi:hypothetical protein